MHADSTLTVNEVGDRVLGRFQIQEVSGNVGDVADVLDDCFLPADQEKILREVATRNQQSRVATETRAACQTTYVEVLKALPADLKKSGEKERKKKERAEKQAAKSQETKIQRSYGIVETNFEQVMKSALPTAAKAWTDHFNGRWRLSYRTMHASPARSISWTAMGTKRAAAEAGGVSNPGFQLFATIPNCRPIDIGGHNDSGPIFFHLAVRHCNARGNGQNCMMASFHHQQLRKRWKCCRSE